ncbi:MAG TPA: choice-of-anchor D domain-containing protein, partial [Myxococcota bacterium]|nr:choice-of-anchor D domain-containing protein [Myxococcota bacterium]
LLQAVLDIPTDAIDLGTAQLNGPALVRNLEVRNRGNRALVLETVSATEPFSVVNGCPASLAPGELCVISVQFVPGQVGEFTGSLDIVSNAIGGSRRIALRAQSQARPEPVVRVSPTTISFGERMAGTGSTSQRITIRNEGGADASVAVALSSPHFQLSGSTCGPILASQETCFADVVFQPGAFGLRSAQVVVTSNSEGSPHVVTVAGTGCRPAIVTVNRGGGRLSCAP